MRERKQEREKRSVPQDKQRARIAEEVALQEKMNW